MRICLAKDVQSGETLYLDCKQFNWDSVQLVGTSEDSSKVFNFLKTNGLSLDKLPTKYNTITERVMDYILGAYKPTSIKELQSKVEEVLKVSVGLEVTEENIRNMESSTIEEIIDTPIDNYGILDEIKIEDNVGDKDTLDLDENLEKLDKPDEDLDAIKDSVENIQIEKDIQNSEEIEKATDTDEPSSSLTTQASKLKQMTSNLVQPIDNLQSMNYIHSDVILSDDAIKRASEKFMDSLVDMTLNRFKPVIENIIEDKIENCKPEITTSTTKSNQIVPEKHIDLNSKTILYLNLLTKLRGDIIAETLVKVIKKAVEEENAEVEQFLEMFFKEI